MQLLDQYFKIKDQIYERFNCSQNYPINDYRNLYWAKNENYIVYSTDKNITTDITLSKILTVKSFLIKNSKYSMIKLDKNFNDISLGIFDNKKIIKFCNKKEN